MCCTLEKQVNPKQILHFSIVYAKVHSNLLSLIWCWNIVSIPESFAQIVFMEAYVSCSDVYWYILSENNDLAMRRYFEIEEYIINLNHINFILWHFRFRGQYQAPIIVPAWSLTARHAFWYWLMIGWSRCKHDTGHLLMFSHKQ